MAPTTPKKSLMNNGSSRKTLPSSGSPRSKRGSASKMKVEFSDASPSPSSAKKKIDVSGRAKSRDLVRWTVEKDVKVLLSIHELCKIKKINLPYDEIAKQIADHCTGNALGQHLDKLYKKTLEENPDNAPQFEGSRTGIRMRKAMASSYTSGRKRSHKAKQYEATPDTDEDPDEGDPDDSFGEKTKPNKGKYKKGKRIKEEDSSSEEYMVKTTPKKKKKVTKAKEFRKSKAESDSEDEKPSLSDKGEDNDLGIGEGYVGAGSSLLPYNSKRDDDDETEVAETQADPDDGADGVKDAAEKKEKDVVLSKQIVIALPSRLLASLFLSPSDRSEFKTKVKPEPESESIAQLEPIPEPELEPKLEPVAAEVEPIRSELTDAAPAAVHPTTVNPTHLTSNPFATTRAGPHSMTNLSSVPDNSTGGIGFMPTNDPFPWPPLLGENDDETYIDWDRDLFENDPMIAGAFAKFEDNEKDFFGL